MSSVPRNPAQHDFIAFVSQLCKVFMASFDCDVFNDRFVKCFDRGLRVGVNDYVFVLCVFI